ncbi:MAG: hypothetical protein QOG75_6166 [Mycobacterium sp.]|jgi:hypothetical protein|nr:hypothetical protein [Mycobacterium sp.]
MPQQQCDRCPHAVHTDPCPCGCLGRQHWHDDANLYADPGYAAPVVDNDAED